MTLVSLTPENGGEVAVNPAMVIQCAALLSDLVLVTLVDNRTLKVQGTLAEVVTALTAEPEPAP